jgi:S-adenosylmethionine hydrolase
VNPLERLAGNSALEKWVNTGEIEIEKDGTVLMEPEGSSAVLDGESLIVTVSGVSASYGNLVLDLIHKDLEAADIELGDFIEIEIKGQFYRCLVGTSYGDVPRREWVLFRLADGYYLLSRNFGDAAGTTGITEGETLIMRKM